MRVSGEEDGLFPPMTTVVSLRGWGDKPLPDDWVRIDRRTKWGNPFPMKTEGERERVIQQYSEWILTQPHLLAALGELRGKKLACWCSPKHCHGHVLAKLADMQEAA